MNYCNSHARSSGSVIDMSKVGDFQSISAADMGEDYRPGPGHDLNVEFWLPQAAPMYDISPNLRDYLVVPTVAFWSGVPNTNGDAVKTVDTLKFRPTDGMCMYKTFQGKGTYWNHENNTVPELASGVIFDSYLTPVVGIPNSLKIVLLLGFCREKNPNLAQRIDQRKVTSYSVGMNYEGYEISSTGDVVSNMAEAARAITQPNQSPYPDEYGSLVFRYLRNPRGFECSAVPTPAFASAVGDTIMDMSDGSTRNYR